MTYLKAAAALFLLLLGASLSASDFAPLDVAVKAESVPLVGKEGVVTAAVTVDRDLPALTVEVQLPNGGRIVGPSSLTVERATKDEPVRLKATVVFDTPGLKFVRAVAKCAEKPGVVWSDVAYVLLDIGAASSSVVTDTRAIRTEPRLMKKGDGQPGGRPKFDLDLSGATEPESVTFAGGPRGFVATPPESVASGQLVVTGKWSFTDRAGNPIGQRNAKLELRKPTILWDVVLATTYSDWEGNFVFPAVTDPEDFVYVRCYTLSQGTGNAAGCKYDRLSDWYSQDTNLVRFFGGGTRSIGEWCVDSNNPNYKAWWIVDDMAKAYATPPDPVGGHFVYWSPGSTVWAHYERGGSIYLAGGDADDTPDTVLHEMGHSVMYEIYGEYMPTTYCPEPHYLMGSSHVNCAWTEGWAHVWHMWTTNDPIRDYPGGGAVDLEAATWGDGNDEGRTVEGRVAGAVWDIADSAEDGYDKFSDGWLNIWHIMYHHNCDKFSEFWGQWKAHNFNTHGAVASIYQSTIDFNTPPAFGGLPDITVAEDVFLANAMDLDDYASDAESYDHQLVFEIASVSPPNLQIGIDPNHRVNLQGALNWHGTADVLIRCSDGIVSINDTFTVTVTPVNDPPVIQGVPDVTLDEDTSLLSAINLSKCTTDPETSSVALTYAITANTNPNCGVSIVGGYIVRVVPVANWFGISDVTVRATDPQGLWSEDTFRITVNSVNDPPVISGLPDRTLNEDTSLINTIDLWAYTTDVEIPSSSLSYYVQSSELPAGAVTISSNRYVSITPPANYFGSGNVTIRVWDWEQGYGEDTFLVTVNPVPDTPAWDPIPDQTQASSRFNVTRTVDLYEYASDPDGPLSELTFTVVGNTNPSIGAAILQNRTLRISYPAYVTGHSQITVRATDPTSRWAEDTLDVVVGRRTEPCSEAFGLPNGSWVFTDPKTVTVSHPYGFYIQDDARTSGIRVISTLRPDEGRYVAVAGQLTTYEGERAIDLRASIPGEMNPNPPRPLAMHHGSLGGVWPGSYTPAVPTGKLGGLYNVGLLVQTTGTVVSRNLNSFWIADGSGVHYSYSTKGLYVDCQPIAMYSPTRGSRVTVTGISGATTLLDGTVVNTVRLRDRADIKGLGGRVAYIYNTASSTAAEYASMLGARSWQTTTIPLSVLTSRDLSSYDALIIGADTGTWSEMARVNHVINSGKPVIAMGTGGGRFLDQVPDLYIGYLNSGYFDLSSGYADDLSSDLYWWDTIISIPGNRGVYPLVSVASTLALVNPPTNVYGLLRHPTLSQYWSIAYQGRYAQWGFNTTPANMTQVGQDLLVNCIYYMLAKK